MNEEKITLGGGCFWCIEAVYENVKGVSSALSGYMGGHVDNPTYEDICTGTTGHAEVVELTYDSSLVSLEKILDVFWNIHDPTTLNRQGNDVGTQYRSIIFYHDERQKEVSLKAIEKATSIYVDPIVTEVKKVERFYEAEKYHQDYFANNPNQGYCRLVVAPKVQKFKSTYKELQK